MARNAECKCERGRFTCGHCFRHAKPYFYTLSDGSALPPPAALRQPAQPALDTGTGHAYASGAFIHYLTTKEQSK